MVEAPREVGLRDHERWGKADDVVVGLLAEDAAFFEGFAEGAGGGVELDADPEAFAADFGDVRAAEIFEEVDRVVAEFGGAGGEVFVDDDAEGGAGDGAGERVAAEGAAMVAGVEDAEDLARGEDGGDGVEAAGERLANDDDVGRDVFVLVGEELAGAAEAGLNLVEHEEDVVLAADCGGLRRDSRRAAR